MMSPNTLKWIVAIAYGLIAGQITAHIERRKNIRHLAWWFAGGAMLLYAATSMVIDRIWAGQV